MTPPTTDTTARLERTPALEALLGRLRARLVRQVLLHGAGSVLLAVVAWMTFAFLADWALHVPAGVRWFHLAVLFTLPAFVAWRELLRPLRRVPDRAGLAILIERTRPDLRELLVSAVQLQTVEDPSGSPELIEQVLSNAERAVGDVRLDNVLDVRRPRLRFALGTVALALGLASHAVNPNYSSIFLARLFGGDVGWPQLTHLTVSVPVSEDRARVDVTPESIHVRVARGSDLPLVVRAEGVVPRDVTVHFEGGQEMLLPAGGDGLFRTVLRSTQEDLAFHVTGGDDRDGLPSVRVEVLQPPDVAGLALRVEPPAYTGLEPRLEFDQDVVVPQGSRLEVTIQPDPAEATGRVRILPADQQLELVSRPFPAAPGAGGDEVPEPIAGLGFDWTVEASIRYRLELIDSGGLTNPDPGLFAVHVVEDRRPEVRVLSPGRSDVETVPGGSLSLRVRAEDDHGLVAMTWRARDAGAAEPRPTGGDLELTSLPDAGAGQSQRVAVLARRRLEVGELVGAGAQDSLEGRQLLLDVFARDNRPMAASDDGQPAELDPEAPGVGRASPVRVRIVSEEELMRRVQDRLARVRGLAASLEELQRQKSARIREMLQALESDSPQAVGGSSGIAVALTGQRRVHGDAQALGREVAAVVETVLYARLDDKAGALLEHVDEQLATITDRTFHPEPWRDLAAAHREGRLGTPAFAGALVGILDLALIVSEEDTLRATEALDRSGQAVDIADVHAELTETLRQQTLALEHCALLLERLAEWDNFQSILTLTRDILNRQKTLAERTRQFARER